MNKPETSIIEKNGKILDEIGQRPSQGIRTLRELMETPREDVPPNLKRIYDEETWRIRREETFFKMLDEIDKMEINFC